MLIHRRVAIRNLLIIAGGAMILPACYRAYGQSTIKLNSLSVTGADETLLELISETLIPETDTPGAKSLKLHLFVLKMVDDCYSPKDQQSFVKGLQDFSSFAKDKIGKNFFDASVQERELFLKDITTKYGDNKAIVKFYEITKKKAIQGYLNSEYVMDNLVKYELVPGRYNGYFPA